jgi:hypothetical protein
MLSKNFMMEKLGKFLAIFDTVSGFIPLLIRYDM